MPKKDVLGSRHDAINKFNETNKKKIEEYKRTFHRFRVSEQALAQFKKLKFVSEHFRNAVFRPELIKKNEYHRRYYRRKKKHNLEKTRKSELFENIVCKKQSERNSHEQIETEENKRISQRLP